MNSLLVENVYSCLPIEMCPRYELLHTQQGHCVTEPMANEKGAFYLWQSHKIRNFYLL
jgi:hypothetical protein